MGSRIIEGSGANLAETFMVWRARCRSGWRDWRYLQELSTVEGKRSPLGFSRICDKRLLSMVTGDDSRHDAVDSGSEMGRQGMEALAKDENLKGKGR